MDLPLLVVTAILFVLLTPGVLLTLPDNLGYPSTLYMQSVVHGVAFSLALSVIGPLL